MNDIIYILNEDEIYKYVDSEWEQVDITIPYTFDKNSAISFGDEIHIFKEDYHYKYDGEQWNSYQLPIEFGIINAVIANNEIHILSGTHHWQVSAFI